MSPTLIQDQSALTPTKVSHSGTLIILKPSNSSCLGLTVKLPSGEENSYMESENVT